MPNLTKTNLEIRGDVKEFLSCYKPELDSGSGLLNAVIPQPRDVQIWAGTCDRETLPETCSDSIHYLFRCEEPRSRDHYDIWQKQLTENQQKYGAPHWQDWAFKNWYTKWDTFDLMYAIEEGGLFLEFTTPYSSPTPVIQELARKFPYLSFAVQYSSDTGCFTGEYELCVQSGVDSLHNGCMDIESITVYQLVWGE